jgi:methionyl-tRNA formyltransferase
MPLTVLFFGTPAFAVPSLRAIAGSHHRVVGVVTQPDRPRGRGQKVVPGAVKVAALDLRVPILQPDRLKTSDFMQEVSALGADIGVVAAYGKLLPQALLDTPRLGMINVHASLLPRWRGAAPIHRAIVAGDGQTGITIMRVVLALDAGPMLMKTVVDIDPDERTSDLEPRLAEAGAALVVRALDAIESGTVAEEPQDEGGVTYAPRLSRDDSQVDWQMPARAIHNQIRGLHPWPLAAATIGGVRLKLIASRVEPADTAAPALHHEPGIVTRVGRDGVAVRAKDGILLITHVQPEGKAPMSAGDYLNGRPIDVGTRVEPV